MDIAYKSKKLRKQYENSKEAFRAYGDQVGRKYIDRINTIKAAKDLDALCKDPALRCHPLKGDRDGQWAVKLTGNYRLVFTLEGDTPQIVRIEEVTDYHGE